MIWVYSTAIGSFNDTIGSNLDPTPSLALTLSVTLKVKHVSCETFCIAKRSVE